MTNRLNNMENDIGMHEQYMRDQARKLSKKHGKLATAGRTPVRIDKKTVIFRKNRYGNLDN